MSKVQNRRIKNSREAVSSNVGDGHCTRGHTKAHLKILCKLLRETNIEGKHIMLNSD